MLLGNKLTQYYHRGVLPAPPPRPGADGGELTTLPREIAAALAGARAGGAPEEGAPGALGGGDAALDESARLRAAALERARRHAHGGAGGVDARDIADESGAGRFVARIEGAEYFELDIDVGSSTIAKHTVGLAARFSSAVVVDLALLLQGHHADELPEAVIGCVRVDRIELTNAQRLDIDNIEI